MNSCFHRICKLFGFGSYNVTLVKCGANKERDKSTDRTKTRNISQFFQVVKFNLQFLANYIILLSTYLFLYSLYQ